MCFIIDPLGQTHSPTSNNHYSRLKVILFCEILKKGDGRMDGRTDVQLDNTCKNSYHYRP